MSTKNTLSYGDDFHLYTEAFDNEHIYLNLNNVEFEATQNSVCITIPVAIWEVIRQQVGVDLSWVDKSDQFIEEYVKKFVNERIEHYKENNNSIMKLAGCIAFGIADEPEESQIQQGITYYQKLREQQQLIMQQITKLQKTNIKL
jgi:hypothetical protein